MIRGGDKLAFEYMYKSNVQFLFNFAKKNISSREDCEEMIQDVFLSLWERQTESINWYLSRKNRLGGVVCS